MALFSGNDRDAGLTVPAPRPRPADGDGGVRDRKVVITGAAGLVGLNLVLLLTHHGYRNVVAIDKIEANLGLARRLNPMLRTVHADLATHGPWEDELAGADAVIILHAQITGKEGSLFVRNNLEATQLVLDASKRHGVPYGILTGSSVVHSVADDDYTRTKIGQERLF